MQRQPQPGRQGQTRRTSRGLPAGASLCPHSRSSLVPPLFCLSGAWGPHGDERGPHLAPWPQVHQSHDLAQQKRLYRDLLAVSITEERPSTSSPAVSTTHSLCVPAPQVGKASSSCSIRVSGTRSMFLVHNSFILMFPVAYFLSQNTERLEMAFANNSMIVEPKAAASFIP